MFLVVFELQGLQILYALSLSMVLFLLEKNRNRIVSSYCIESG